MHTIADLSIQISESLSTFYKRSSPKSTYNCFSNKGIKHIKSRRLVFLHRDHKFKHDYHDSLNPICSCGLDIETTCHYLFQCPNFINERTLLLNDVSRITKNALPSCDTTFVKLLFYDEDLFDSATNTLLISPCIDFFRVFSSNIYDGLHCLVILYFVKLLLFTLCYHFH